LPVAENFNDIDIICAENERVRQIINEYFDFSDRKNKLSKIEILRLMKTIPSFRTALITAYKSAQVVPYDFENDPVGEYVWYNVAKEYTEKYPLHLELPPNPNIADVYSVVESICNHYKNLIEDNGLWGLLYNDNRKPKHERAAQLLFFGIADSYCTVNDIDLYREINNGRGSVDFKLSRGARDKVIVEVKLTSNKQLTSGFDAQIPIYMKQEKTNKAVYLIIDNVDTKALENFTRYYNVQPSGVKEKIVCKVH
jgi:hypothetical protein